MKPLVLIFIAGLSLSGCATSPQANTASQIATVVVEFVINEQGSVEDVQVVSSTNPEFNQPSIQAISKWRFSPGMKNGKPAKIRAQQTIEFNIKDGPGAIKQP